MLTVDEVLKQAQTLTHEEQVKLLKQLVDLVAEPSPISRKRSILEFEGIAARLADDEDPQDYVKRLRSEWD